MNVVENEDIKITYVPEQICNAVSAIFFRSNSFVPLQQPSGSTIIFISFPQGGFNTSHLNFKCYSGQSFFFNFIFFHQVDTSIALVTYQFMFKV